MMNQVKAGVVLNYVIIVLNIVVGLLYTPFMLRMMGQSEYGLYSLVASVIAYLTLLDMGFGNAVVRYTAKYRAEGKLDEQYRLFGMFIVMYSLIGVVVAALGFVLYACMGDLFGDTLTAGELGRAKILVIIMVLNLSLSFPLSIFGSIVNAYEKFVFQKVVNIVRLVLNYVVMIFVLEYGGKAVALVVVQTVFNFATLFLNLWYCRRELHVKVVFGKFNWSLFMEIAIYSFWIFLNTIMDKIYWGTGQFVLGATTGTIAVAVFSLAISLEQMYMTFSSSIASVLLPKLTGMVANRSADSEVSRLFIRTGRLQHIVMSFILVGFIVFGRSFINLWAGPGYEDVYIITLIFFVALFTPLIQNTGITILQARNQMKFRSILYVVIAVVSLAFQIVGAKYWGAIGCAIPIAGALILGQGVIMNVYYHRVQHIDILRFWAEITRMSLVPALFIVVGLLAAEWISLDGWGSLMLGILVFSLLYIPVFWRFSMNADERDLIGRPIKKLLHRTT